MRLIDSVARSPRVVLGAALLAVWGVGPAGCTRAGAAGERPAATTDSLAANKALVRRFYAALNTGDYAAADSLVAPDYRHHVVSDTGFRAIDWAAFKAGNAGVRRAFPDWVLAPDLLIAEGEYVAALVTGRGTHRGSLAGEPATGRASRLPFALVHQVRGGRLVADWEVVNAEPAMRALRAGAVPAPPEARRD